MPLKYDLKCVLIISVAMDWKNNY